MTAQTFLQDARGLYARLNITYNGASHTFDTEGGSYASFYDEETGHWIDNRILFLHGTASTIRTLVSRFDRLFRETQSDVNALYIVEQTDGEMQRTATVFGGTFEPLDHNVLRRDLTYGAVQYALVLRRGEWRIGRTGERWHDVANAPGYAAKFVPSSFATETMDGYLRTLSIAPNGQARGRKFWFGIKSAKQNIDGFTPRIRVGRTISGSNATQHVWLGEDVQWADSLGGIASPTNALGGTCLTTTFSSVTALRPRYTAPLRYWNAHTETVANRIKYVGEYLLLARVMVQGGSVVTGVDESTIIALQAGTALGANGTGATNEPVYVPFRQNVWQVVSLGRIRVGSKIWDHYIQSLEGLGNFRVEVRAQLVDGTPGVSRVYFDDCFILPTDAYVYVETPMDIKSDSRIDVITTERGDVAAFAASRTYAENYAGGGTSPRYSTFSVELPEVDRSPNWGVPSYQGSKFVYVMEDLQATSSTGTSHVSMIAEPMARHYAPGA